eukprot:gene7288-403_t
MVDIPDPPDLGAQGISAIILLAIALVLMAGDWVKPDLNFSTLLAVFMAARIITVNEGTDGFGNSGLLSVMALYAVAEGISQTGGLARVIQWTTGQASTRALVIIRMLIPVMIASAFINNTPIVAVMIPIVMAWARRSNQSPKAILICLSYMAIFGGTCTLIGTSTNLVIAGFYEDYYPDEPPIGIFDISLYGLAYAAWGFSFMIMFSSYFSGEGGTSSQESDLMVGLKVPKDSPLVGVSVEAAGLRHLEGLFLVTVTRGGNILHAVGPEVILEEDDVLSFAGDLTMVGALSTRLGLPLLDNESDDPWELETGRDSSNRPPPGTPDPQLIDKSNLLKITVKMGSLLSGKSIRDIGFRSRFGAVVLGVKRAVKVMYHYENKRVEGNLGNIILEEGDELLIDGRSEFQVESDEVQANFESIEWVKSKSGTEYMTGYLIPVGIKWVKSEDGTECMTVYLIPEGSRLAGKTVNEVGLAGMRGIYLAHLDRADGTVVKVESPSTVLEEGDTLWFYSDLEGLSFLFSFRGMQTIEKKQIKKAGVNPLERRLVQVVVATHSPLIGKTVQDSRFRTKYNAAIVGVHRRGERLKQKIGDIMLLAGDLLLVDTGDQFLVLHDGDNTVFSLVSEVPESAPQKSSKMWIALAILIAMVTVQVVQSFTSPNEPYIHLWPAALLTAVVMMLFRCMSWEQAKKSYDWTVYLTIASSFGISTGMSNSGVAGNIAWLFIQLGLKIGGRAGILSCIYIVTALLSEILTNNAAAALMFPVATIAGDALGISPKLMSYTLMLGASSSFISPFGYQVNLMIFNAGAMKFKDLASIGVPIQCSLMVFNAGAMKFKDLASIGVRIQVNLMIFNAGAMRFIDLASKGVPSQLWMWLGATLIMGLVSIYIMLGVSVGLAITVSIGAVFQDHIRARMRSLKVPNSLKIPSRTATEQHSHL